LLTNAIKFSLPKETLRIQLRVSKNPHFEQKNKKPLAYYLETIVVNLGSKFELKKKEKRFKTFAFDLAGPTQIQNTQ
jgi:hypothetical protein